MTYVGIPDGKNIPIREKIQLPLLTDSYRNLSPKSENTWQIRINTEFNSLAVSPSITNVGIQIDNQSVQRLTNLSQDAISNKKSSLYYTVEYAQVSPTSTETIKIIIVCIEKSSLLLKDVTLTQLATNKSFTFRCEKSMDCKKADEIITEEFRLKPNSEESSQEPKIDTTYLKIILPPLLILSSTIILLLVKLCFKKCDRKKKKKGDINKVSEKITPVDDKSLPVELN